MYIYIYLNEYTSLFSICDMSFLIVSAHRIGMYPLF